jgi:hypothetical protein
VNIEERLSIELKKSTDIPLPGRPLSWQSTLARARRRRASYVVGVALASIAACAAVIAGGFALTGEDPTATRPARNSTAGPIESAMINWIEELAAGDYWSAWRLVGPASKRAFGGFQAFKTTASGDYRGAWARWAGIDFDLYQTSVASSGEGSVVVATLVGEVRQEASPPALDAHAVVVRAVGDEVGIEPAVAQYEINLLTPRFPQPVDSAVVTRPVAADTVFRAEVTKSTMVIFDVVDIPGFEGRGRFDDRDPAGLRSARWKPPEPLPPGRHTLTVVSSTAQGPIDATSVIFTVE